MKFAVSLPSSKSGGGKVQPSPPRGDTRPGYKDVKKFLGMQTLNYSLCILNAVRCPNVTYVRNAGRGQLSSE